VNAVRVELDGKKALGSATLSWSFTEGVRPHFAEVDLLPSDADALVSGALRPITLRISTGGSAVEIRNLYVISRVPSDTPQIARVQIADRRWFWGKVHVLRRFNMRRNVGYKRLAPGSLDVLSPVKADVWYAPFSLPGESSSSEPWSGSKILDSVLRFVLKRESESGGASAGFIIENTISSGLANYPIENLELDDPGDAAIERVLSYLPQAGVCVDADGTVRVFDRTSERDRKIVEDLGPEKVGRGHVEIIDLARVRPSEVRVHFTRECEVRFDFDEPSATGGTVARGSEDLFVENVLPVPDFTLKLTSGESVSQGTWITIGQALSAWGAPPGLGRLDYDILRKAFVPYLDLWAPLRLAGQRDPDADWGSRLEALQHHWRKTYRINRRFMDRILQLHAYRVAVIDQETGTRAPAMAYGDYCTLGSQRSMLAEAFGGKADLTYCQNYDAYPFGGALGGTEKPAPATVTILDHDQGIVHLDYLMDRARLFEMVMPGQLDETTAPNGSLKGRNNPITFNAIGRSHQVPRFKSGYKLILLLSAIPGAPNDERQLQTLVRRPQDVVSFFPSGARTALLASRGPVVDVRIGAAVETARVAWADSKGKEIKKAFGIESGKPDLKSLTINLGNQEGIGIRGASLDAIADAAAARVYAGALDRPMGQKAVTLNTAAQLAGWLSEVRWIVATTGEVSTEVRTAPSVVPLNLFALLPANVRRVVLKTAQSGR